ncbi:MAG: amidohydrolase family protein [Acidobacteriia bacterium]|nr:amidohydrolase family protein [Terriglobia bacterium]
MKHNRRQWLGALGAGAAAGAFPQNVAAQGEAPKAGPLDISDYQPKSMLRIKETKVARSRYPVIDVHSHLSWTRKSQNGVSLAGERRFVWPAERVLQTMDRKNIRAMVNLTGGYDSGLEEAIAKFDKAHPGRFYTFTEPSYSRLLEPNYPQLQADAIAQAHRAGARGLKILKTLGLYLRENITSGKLVAIDDRRFDPMWDACGQLNLPVAIHIADPVAFFTPTDRFNERFEELNRHPDWSFHGLDFPSLAALLEARNRVFARHPKTQFIGLHVGHMAEDLDNVSEALDRYPNMSVDIAARIGELGRQPRRARQFFDRYQDRILFGTDAVPEGHETPQQIFGDELYEIYYRFLETDDEYFDYAPAPIPPQGRWRIYGLRLPDEILRKVYNANAAKVLRIDI